MKKLDKNKKLTLIKFIIFILLVIVLIILIRINYNDAQRKQALTNTITDIATLNENQVFSIDKIYLYSSASATNNETKKSLWDINVYQYTDIAMYISSGSEDQKANKIKSIYIDNINFKNLETGSAGMFTKDLSEFGKFNLNTENLVKDKLEFKIIERNITSSLEDSINNTINTNTITGTAENVEIVNTENNVSNSEVKNFYSDLSQPLTLEYVNLAKEKCLITDIENPLVYDGSILKRAGINLNSIACTVTFQVHITNELDENYVANVSFSIPLKDDTKSIFDGSFSKEIGTKTAFYAEEK